MSEEDNVKKEDEVVIVESTDVKISEKPAKKSAVANEEFKSKESAPENDADVLIADDELIKLWLGNAGARLIEKYSTIKVVGDYMPYPYKIFTFFRNALVHGGKLLVVEEWSNHPSITVLMKAGKKEGNFFVFYK